MSAQQVATRAPYSDEEDIFIINYICKHKKFNQVKGVALWKSLSVRMALKKKYERTYYSLKERYTKRLIPNIQKFDLPKDQVEKLLEPFRQEEVRKRPKKQATGRRKEYTQAEDEVLIWWVLKEEGAVRGNRLWIDLERTKIIPGRSWESLRNRFLRTTYNNLHLLVDKKKFELVKQRVEGDLSFIVYEVSSWASSTESQLPSTSTNGGRSRSSSSASSLISESSANLTDQNPRARRPSNASSHSSVSTVYRPETNASSHSCTISVSSEDSDSSSSRQGRDSSSSRPKERDSSSSRSKERDSSSSRSKERDSSSSRPKERDSSSSRPKERDSSSSRPKERDSSSSRSKERDSSSSRPKERDSSSSRPKEPTDDRRSLKSRSNSNNIESSSENEGPAKEKSVFINPEDQASSMSSDEEEFFVDPLYADFVGKPGPYIIEQDGCKISLGRLPFPVVYPWD